MATRKHATSRAWDKATAGTHVDRHAPRLVMATFCVVVLACALVPLVGMAWARTDTTTENRELADFPVLFDGEGSFNMNILSELGTYFDDHFAYRNEAVTANARLRSLLGTSATDQVVVGSDGWLYYGGTLPDYLGQNQLSDRSLANIAHNLSLAQSYVENHEASFLFALAPNKNSLDASHMPYYYLPHKGESNFERLKPYLDEAGVNYVDLFSLFEGRMAEGEEFGYLKLDSHWDNRWALIATDEMLSALGRDELAVDPDSADVRVDFAGDLQSMLYPSANLLEANGYYAGFNDGSDSTGANWTYIEGDDVTDGLARTKAAPGVAAQGSLLMFRDSFGNALLPFWASAFESATFSKLVPYNLAQLAQEQADAVVVERAERHLGYLATDPPIMSVPAQSAEAGLSASAVEVVANVDVDSDGSYWVVKGSVADELPSADARIQVVVEREGEKPLVFDPFWTSVTGGTGAEAGVTGTGADAPDADGTDAIFADQGFLFYVPQSSMDLQSAVFRVYVSG